MKFVADTMIQKLARWLRILGYDVVSDSTKSLKNLIEIKYYKVKFEISSNYT